MSSISVLALALGFLQLQLQFQLIPARVFERCELAAQLQHRYGLPAAQVATLVCIAQHSSDLNTAAFGGGSGPAGGSHGIFQISDVYWCSPPGQGAGCGLSCARLRDDDIADDVLCVRKIYAEHQRISGDGFTAWQAYGSYCRQDAASYVAGCGLAGDHHGASSYQQPQHQQPQYVAQVQHVQQAQAQAVHQVSYPPSSRGKIYSRCELAQELYYQHKLPMQQIPTWVCIAQHESSYNTAAVGRLNADGSADHGLFQISDLFWCTHDQRGGKGCHAACNQFLDSSIVDDVQCIRKIHQEHTQISGDGFTAWTVYNRDCRNQRYEQVAACFAKPQPTQVAHTHPNAIGPVGKVSYAYQYGQTTTVSPFYGQAQTVSGYQGNPFLRPHPNAIGQSLKPQYAGSSPANPLLHYKHHTTHKQQQHYQQQQQHYYTTPKRAGKVYTRCELAQELYFSHKFPMQDLATWVCIAEHESRLDTSAVGRLNADGSADHGLFQISDLYWCGSGGGKGCHIDCSLLLDSDISDDVKCIRTIHEEHTRISGDGFTAWTVYNGHCRDRSRAEIASCFEGKDLPEEKPQRKIEYKPKPKGKIYQRCELAQELYYKHKLPMSEIPTWVCIAQHESSLNTAAVGRLNADGSEDHGLFQISDLYWCSHDKGEQGGKACHIDCDRLLDSDISDDVKCIRTIHEEHTRISGDGFTAWTVYNGHCRDRSRAEIASCFEGKDLPEEKPQRKIEYKPKPKGKIYQRCELAQELYYKHKLPMSEIPTWVCIAQHESSLNTAAVGRLNADGSEDHGLFQISDLYWCSHDKGEQGGKACHIDCDRLLDSDISDDVQCIRTIHEEHTRLSGDGFTAWTVYNGHCRHQSLAQLSDCFDGNEIAQTELQKPVKPNHYGEHPQLPTTGQQVYDTNPFLKGVARPQNIPVSTPTIKTTVKPSAPIKVVPKHPYGSNPFLQTIKPSLEPTAKLTESASTPKSSYNKNPFINQSKPPAPNAIQATESKPSQSANYNSNPFLNSLSKPTPAPALVKPPLSTTPGPPDSSKSTHHPYVNSDIFRNEIIKFTATSSATTTTNHLRHSQSSTTNAILSITKPTGTTTTTTRQPTAPTTTHWPITKPSSTTPKATSISTRATTQPTPRTTIRSTTQPTTRTTSRVATQPTNRDTTRLPTRPTTRPTTRATTRPTTRATTRATTRPTTRATTRPTSQVTTRSTTRPTTRPSETTQSTTRATTRPTTRKTTLPTTLPTTSPTTRPSARATSQPTTRATTRPTSRRTTLLTTRPTTRSSARATTRPTSRSTVRPTAQKPTTYWTTNRPTTRTTIHPITLSTTRTTARTTTRSTTRASSTIPTTRTTIRTTTIRPSTQVMTTRAPVRATTPPTTATRPTTRSTTRATTRTTTTRPTKATLTTRSTTRATTRATTTRPTKATLTTRSTTTKATTRATTTQSSTQPTSRATTPSTTTWRQFTSTTPKTTTTATRTPFQSKSTPSTPRPQSFTTPRPYLFTTTTVGSKTTTDPFSHPFFAKFKAKFEHFSTKPTTTTKPTPTPSRFTASPYYAKFQDNNAKGSLKTVYSYSFGRP